MNKYIDLRFYFILIVLITLLVSSCNGSMQSPSANDTISDLPEITHFALHPMPHLGVVVDREIMVLDVDPNGMADRADIRQKDILITLNGSRFKEEPDKVREVLEAVLYDEEKRPLELVLEREGRELTIEISTKDKLPIGDTFESPLPTPTPVLSEKGLLYF